MDRAKFEQHLKDAGFPEIRTNQLEPGKHNPEHFHPWDVHALVVEGDITLTVDGKSRNYKVGDEFTMKAGCRHTEDVGPQGVKYVVGRRPVNG